MNYKMIGRFLGLIVAVEAAFLLPAMAVSLGYGEWNALGSFGITLGIMAVVAGGLLLLCRNAGRLFGAREGLVCVGLSWVVLSALGCLPFYFSREIPRYIDAFFEIVSGFTTTGCSVLAEPEKLSRGILYWRSFSHWLGGMGVLVFLLAIAPGGSGGFTMHLLRAESPGPDVGKLVPRMQKTAMILYIIYIVMTVINFIFLLFDPEMNWLEALCTAFGTAGTGGLALYSDSMMRCTPYAQCVTTVFMFLFGVNFSCYYLLLLGNIKSVLKDEELRAYVLLAVGVVVAIALNIFDLYKNWEMAFRQSAFQVSSLITSTGYVSADYDAWPAFSKGLLILVMVVGACAGSTGGGFKVVRVLMVLKSLKRNIRKVMNPKKVEVVRVGGKAISETVLDNTNAYLAAWCVIMLVSMLVILADPYVKDFTTGFTATLACFNNMGPGMAMAGPTENFSAFSDLSKIVLSLDMLAGRLEIFPILILFSKGTWKGR